MTKSKFIFFYFLLISTISIQAQKKAYICSAEQIYLADLDNCSAQLISNTPGANWTDIALHPTTGVLYVINFDSLYWVDQNNGIVHAIGSTYIDFNALTFAKDGTLYGMSPSSNYLYTINIQTSAPSSLGSTMLPASSAGDLAFYNDTLYMLGTASAQYRVLAKINLNNTYNSAIIGYLTDEYTYGLGTLGCDKHLYGFFHRDVYKLESIYPINKQIFCSTIISNQITGVASINEDVGLTKIDLGADTILCAGTIYTLDLPINNVSYTWSNGNTNASFSINSAGTYWVEALNDSCIVRDTIQIDYVTSPSINFLADTILCQGQSFSLSIDAYNIDNSNDLYNESVHTIFTSDSTQIYTINISGGPCEVDFNDTVVVDYFQIPTHSLNSMYYICEGDSLILDAWNKGATYLWQDNSTNSKYTITNKGTYSVEIKNFCGGLEHEIVVQQNCNCIEIPNAFTPNNDAYNDFFRPIIKCPLENIRFRIFNRWGQTVYDEQGISAGWDGYFQGVACVQDVYIYLLEYDFNGVEKAIKGQVSLLN